MGCSHSLLTAEETEAGVWEGGSHLQACWSEQQSQNSGVLTFLSGLIHGKHRACFTPAKPRLPPPLSVPGIAPEGTRKTLERIQPPGVIFRCRGIHFCKTWVPHLTRSCRTHQLLQRINSQLAMFLNRQSTLEKRASTLLSSSVGPW